MVYRSLKRCMRSGRCAVSSNNVNCRRMGPGPARPTPQGGRYVARLATTGKSAVSGFPPASAAAGKGS